MKRLRNICLPIVLLCAILGLGARCIENDSLYRDDEGYWHVVGEMVNDTNVSASSVTLGAKLFDSQDNVIAETTGMICPVTVQPKSRNLFDLKFAEPELADVARYEVRPVAGVTIPNTLPDPMISLVTEAKRFGIQIAVRGEATTYGNKTFADASVCIAF